MRVRRVVRPKIIERWLLRRLRHRRFYSLAELNGAIGELLRQLVLQLGHQSLGGAERRGDLR